MSAAIRGRQVVIVVAAVAAVWAAVSAGLDVTRARDARARVRAAIPALEAAYAAYAECYLPTPEATPWDLWVAGVDLGDRVRFCERTYREAVVAGADGLEQADRARVARLVDAAASPRGDAGALARAICASIDRRRALLDDLRATAGMAAAPGGDCDAGVDDLRAPGLRDGAIERAFGLVVPVSDVWLVADGDGVVGGARWGETRGVARTSDGTMWERAGLRGALRLAWPLEGPWAVARGRGDRHPRVYVVDGTTWRAGAELPGIAGVRAMRPTTAGRIVVAERGEQLVVVRLDAGGARVVDIVALGLPAAAEVAIAGDGTVVAASAGGVVQLTPGARAPARDGGAEHVGVCAAGGAAFLQVGDRVLHGGTELGALGRAAEHRLACGDDWVAAIDRDTTQYTLCRVGDGCRTRRLTARAVTASAIAAADRGVVILARMDAYLVAWRDLAPDGTLAREGLWYAADPPPLLHLDGTWLRLAPVD